MDTILTIKKLKVNEIDKFIDDRISSFKNEEIEIGLGTDITSYDGFLGDKTRVNVTCEMMPEEDYVDVTYGSIIFDDKDMFKCLIHEIKNNDDVFESVFKALDKYLFLGSKIRKYNNYPKTRAMIYHQYSASVNKPLSIKLFNKNKTAVCPEVAGVAQNMFKFLGMDSDYIIVGESRDSFHAFNIVYPWGRENEALIFDSSRVVNYRPCICALNSNQKENLLANNKIIITKDQIASTYMSLFSKKIDWINEDFGFSIYKDGYPETIINQEDPFTVQRKLKFKRREL